MPQTENSQPLNILLFSDELSEHFKRINLNWIERYFTPETEDLKVLNEPKKHIVDTGGMVVFAEYQGQIVGTCALKKWSETEYELAKMGVDDDFQGLHIGRKLCEAIIKIAQEKGCQRLFLESNRQLTTALKLYESVGFKEYHFTKSCSEYQRCDISMELWL